MLLAGFALIGFFALGFFGVSANTGATNASEPSGFNVPNLNSSASEEAGGPEDRTLRLTVPAMSRIDDVEVPDAAGSDTEALDSNAATHLQGTGFPWQDGANVYIAGHRLGYPGSPSFLAFYDLGKLENGDEVYVTDSEGTEYTYRVFREFIVEPTDLSVTEPMPGRNILTLQTCTLPDYSQRLIVQAELVESSA
ncbi:class E sortase [Rubrobacter indicoceani]|uniref:class E sortase n=1 Tax=Rubrobacter indicoceani TaxID=2051957 RepID=UPI000E5AA256|nr:class E sortase [Rubrobacter indicoceani]